MGNIFDCCYKKETIEESLIMNIAGVYDDTNKLTRISDIIETRKPDWTNDRFSEMRYNDMFNEAKALRNKMRDRKIEQQNELENSR
jgi:hypothetical protein